MVSTPCCHANNQSNTYHADMADGEKPWALIYVTLCPFSDTTIITFIHLDLILYVLINNSINSYENRNSDTLYTMSCSIQHQLYKYCMNSQTQLTVTSTLQTQSTLIQDHTLSFDFFNVVAWKEPTLLVHHSFVPSIIIDFEDIYDGTFGK